MDLQLMGKVVIITGGANGIGAAITRASLRQGAIPVIVDRDLPACDKLFPELQLERGRGHRGIFELPIVTRLSDPRRGFPYHRATHAREPRLGIP